MEVFLAGRPIKPNRGFLIGATWSQSLFSFHILYVMPRYWLSARQRSETNSYLYEASDFPSARKSGPLKAARGDRASSVSFGLSNQPQSHSIGFSELKDTLFCISTADRFKRLAKRFKGIWFHQIV